MLAELPVQQLTACVLCALHAVRCALPLLLPASRQPGHQSPAKFISAPEPPLLVALSRHHSAPSCSGQSQMLLLLLCRLRSLATACLPPRPVCFAGGFMIESPRDFAARIYSLMEGSSGDSASSGSGRSSGSSGAAPTVDPEVL